MVPPGVTHLSADVTGAQGGNGGSYLAGVNPYGAGGKGGGVASSFAVTPGETLTVVVGAKGADGVGVSAAGTGGGLSAVLRGSTPLVIAGGGGGGGGNPIVFNGSSGSGGAAGTLAGDPTGTGQAGYDFICGGGGGGASGADGGSGGASGHGTLESPGSYPSGDPGSSGNPYPLGGGGDGATQQTQGGSGGAGHHGGGGGGGGGLGSEGGCGGGGGGGGSSLLANAWDVNHPGSGSGDGQVALYYDDAQVTTTTTTAPSTSTTTTTSAPTTSNSTTTTLGPATTTVPPTPPTTPAASLTPGVGAEASARPPAGSSLARTGSPVMTVALAGGTLVLLGGLLGWARRRRLT